MNAFFKKLCILTSKGNEVLLMNTDYIITLKDKAYDFNNRFIIALDGPSASGKGTIAKLLSQKLHMKNFASSIFYRKLASLALSKNLNINSIEEIINLSKQTEALTKYDADDLYNERITQFTSQIAAIVEVRLNLQKPQRLLLEQNLRVVLDGRDIGTIIAPDADLKIFLTASAIARAQRRYHQFIESGKNYDLNDILSNIKERDKRDQERDASPLKPANDAIIIDTTQINAEETLEKILEVIDKS
jgi:cytidylate kinase